MNALNLDLVLGPMVVGAAMSTFLCGIMTTQAYTYFQRYPHDPVWMKAMVLYFLVTDIIHTGTECAIVYRYTVTLFGKTLEILSANWLFATIPVMSVCISSVAQSFFAWRVARLTRIKLIGFVIFALAIVQFLCGIGVTIAVTKVPSFLEFQKFQGVVIPWLVSSALCDVIITSALVWYLQNNKSGISATDDIVTKLIRSTVNTGLITSIWAVLDLVIYLTEDNSLHLLFNFPLAKIYTNSLLSTLNARRSQVDRVQAAGSGGGGSSGSRIQVQKGSGGGANGGVSGTVSIPTWDRGYGGKKETMTTDTYVHRSTIHPETTPRSVHHNNTITHYVDPMYSSQGDDFELSIAKGDTIGADDIEMNVQSHHHQQQQQQQQQQQWGGGGGYYGRDDSLKSDYSIPTNPKKARLRGSISGGLSGGPGGVQVQIERTVVTDSDSAEDQYYYGSYDDEKDKELSPVSVVDKKQQHQLKRISEPSFWKD